MPTHDPNNRKFKMDRPPKGKCQIIHGWVIYEDDHSKWKASRGTGCMTADTYDAVLQMVLKRPTGETDVPIERRRSI